MNKYQFMIYINGDGRLHSEHKGDKGILGYLLEIQRVVKRACDAGLEGEIPTVRVGLCLEHPKSIADDACHFYLFFIYVSISDRKLSCISDLWTSYL
jgi:hypothetical protein